MRCAEIRRWMCTSAPATSCASPRSRHPVRTHVRTTPPRDAQVSTRGRVELPTSVFGLAVLSAESLGDECKSLPMFAQDHCIRSCFRIEPTPSDERVNARSRGFISGRWLEKMSSSPLSISTPHLRRSPYARLSRQLSEWAQPSTRSRPRRRQFREVFLKVEPLPRGIRGFEFVDSS